MFVNFNVCSPNQRSWLAWILWAVVACGVIFAPRVEAYKNFLQDPSVYTGDSRQQITPYVKKYTDDDYANQYYRNVFMPLGVDALYHTASRFFDVNIFARYVGFFLFFITAILTGVGVANLVGRWAGLAAMCYLLSATTVQELTMQGLPRGFAPACMALCFWAASLKRWRVMAACIVFSVLFYPVIAVISGLWLALILCFYHGYQWRVGPHIPSVRSLALLATTACFSVAILLPAVIHVVDYGNPITPAEIAQFPEAGEQGRYATNNDGIWGQSFLYSLQQSRMYFSLVGSNQAFTSLFYIGDFWQPNDCLSFMLGAFLIMIIGLAVCYRKGHCDALYIMVTAFAACIIGYALSRAVLPYGFLPDRYLLYPMTVLLPAALGCALQGICLLFPTPKYRIAPAMIFMLPVLLLGASGVKSFHGRAMVNADMHTLALNENLQHALQQLPDNAIIAGWPDDTMDNIAFSIRRVYLHYETHQAQHTLYTLEMRRRMYVLMNALFDSHSEYIDELRKDGVTHVLIPLSFYKKDKPPRYFQPFDDYMQQHWERWQKSTAAMIHLQEGKLLYEDASWRLVRL